MKRYLLFYRDECYSEGGYDIGGWDDFKGFYVSLQLAKDYLKLNFRISNDCEWWHIVDRETGKILDQS